MNNKEEDEFQKWIYSLVGGSTWKELLEDMPTYSAAKTVWQAATKRAEERERELVEAVKMWKQIATGEAKEVDKLDSHLIQITIKQHESEADND